MVNNLQRAIVLDAMPPLLADVKANDPNDAFLLAMALAGEADYLVAGDPQAGFLQCESIGSTRIVAPATFCTVATRTRCPLTNWCSYFRLDDDEREWIGESIPPGARCAQKR